MIFSVMLMSVTSYFDGLYQSHSINLILHIRHFLVITNRDFYCLLVQDFYCVFDKSVRL